MEQSLFIETYILRLLAAFDEYGTLSKVGEALGVTQPPISRAMQKLETELGVTLFERTKNKIALNGNGKFAAEYAKRIMALQDEMIEKTREHAGIRRTFSVGSVAIQPTMEAEETARRLYAGIQTRHEIDADESRLVSALDGGEFQMIILLRPLEGAEYRSQKYFSERLSVMLPKSHRLAGRKSVSLSDLAGETFVVYNDVGFWDKVKREKTPGTQFIRIERRSEREPISAIVGASDIPSFISNRTTVFTLPENRVAVPISDSEVNVTFYAVCRKESAEGWSALLSEMAKEAET